MTRFGSFLLPCALLAIASPALASSEPGCAVPVVAQASAWRPIGDASLAQAMSAKSMPVRAAVRSHSAFFAEEQTPARPAAPATAQPARPGTTTPPPRPGAAAPAPAAPATPTQPKPATPGTASPEPPQGQAVAPEALTAAIDKLGVLDFPVRTQASRTVRRAPAAQAVPALSKAVASHKDGYVRFRALVLLAGFSTEAAQAPMRAALDDPNDRLREVAYAYFEQHPDPALAAVLLAKLDKEESEFVRPSLIRALAALGTDPKVQQVLLREVNRGQDFFRSSVIEALGAQKALYALTALQTIAKQDGPLQEDAVIALGRIGDKRALDTISAQQHNAPRNRQPSLAAAICLLGVNCESHERFLWETIKFGIGNPGFQDLIRSSARGLAQLAIIGRPNAWATLIDQGSPAVDPARAPIAIALASAAVTKPEAALAALQKSADQKAALSLLRDGFDMLEEDYGEEQFYVTIRRAYWKLPADGADRKAAEALITTLEF